MDGWANYGWVGWVYSWVDGWVDAHVNEWINKSGGWVGQIDK